MAWNGLFKDAATAGKRELTVRRDAYSERDAVSIETWEDDTLFKVRGLNNLRVMGFSNMKSFSPLVAHLNSLLELILTNNGLESLPEEIGTLTRLRLLDASHNQLGVLPPTIYQLSTLQKLSLGNNRLGDKSFPSLDEEGEPFPNLQYVDIGNNQLTSLPEFAYRSTSIIEFLVPYNKIDGISGEISNMSSLKTLEMTHNCVTSLPSEMSLCSKLRTMEFEDNPLSDPRLVKILRQFGATKPKAVLDYLQGEKKSSKGKGKGGKKKKGQRGASPIEDEPTDDVVQIQFSSQPKQIIRVSRPSEYVVIKSMNVARNMRPYLVCAVLRNLDLSDIDNYRLFITLQTKVHETVCKRRRLATIATHSLDSLSLPLKYHCRIADKIKFQPLGWKEETTARRFISYLKENSKDVKGSGYKPHSVDVAAAQISKFLPMVDPTQLVYLIDSEDCVISLPPLTNSENSKITEMSRDILIEVTSSTSLADAKLAMDTLIFELLTNGFRSFETVTPTIDPPPGMEATPITPLEDGKELVVEQVKVIDEVDKLLVMYPSRPDLATENDEIQIIRPV